jgi:hypothetical protein
MISVSEQRLVFKRPPTRARKAWWCGMFVLAMKVST